MKNRRRIILIGSIVEFIIICIFVIAIKNYSYTRVNVDLSQWQSNYILYENNSWEVAEGDVETEAIDLIYGPYIELEKGDYTVKVSYECEYDQMLQVYANSGNVSFIKANTVTLNRNLKELSYDIKLIKDIDNFEVVIKYDGKGYCKISDISIVSNCNSLKQSFVVLLLLFLFVDITYIFKAHNKEFFLFLVIALASSMPLFMHGMDNPQIAHDGMFHLMRIEGIATELKFGNFPARIQSLYMDGYGYPVSIYYGDILLYIPALLRLAGFSVTTCFKSYMLLINLGTTIISYFSFKKIFKEKNIALVLSLVYMTASYRLENVYIRDAVGEYTAMMFLPVVAAAVYGIYSEASDDWKKISGNVLWLSVGMTGLISTHVLSTEMVCFVLGIVCIVFIKRTFRKNTIRVLVLAVVETLVMSLYFLVPFLDYYKNCYVNINSTVDSVNRIQYGGVYLAQYFSFWQNIYGANLVNANERFQMTPGMALMLALIMAIVILYRGKASKNIKIFSAFSIFFLFMASALFPWNLIAENSAVGKILAQVQFPWRYLGIAIVFLVLLLGAILKLPAEKYDGISKKTLYTIIICMCIVTMCSFTSSYCNDLNFVYYYDTAELNTKTVMSGEYLLVDTDTGSLSNEIVSTNMDSVDVIERVGNYIELSCDTGTTEGTIELPLYNYLGYQVTDEYGNEYAIWNGTNNVIGFTLPADFSGVVTVQFNEPWYWKCAMYISVFGLLGIAFFEKRDVIDVIWHGKRCKKQNECI